MLKKIVSVIMCLFIISVSVITASADEISLDEYNFKMTVPENYTVINKGNAGDNLDIIEGFGYTKTSFLDYLKRSGVVLFAVDAKNSVQLQLKTWETDFSKKAVDFVNMSDETMESVSKELVTGDKENCSILHYEDIDMLEVTLSDKDSAGEFCSVQFIMLRNGRFFSLTLSGVGKLTAGFTKNAENIADTVIIKDTFTKAYWTPSTITEMIIITALIIVACIAVVLIIISFIKDRRHKLNGIDSGEDDFIERNNRK